MCISGADECLANIDSWASGLESMRGLIYLGQCLRLRVPSSFMSAIRGFPRIILKTWARLETHGVLFGEFGR